MSQTSNQEQATTKQILKEIREKTKAFIENRKNANCLIDLFSIIEADSPEIKLACIKSFHRIFVQAINCEEISIFTPLNEEDEELSKADKYRMWLNERYRNVQKKLLDLLQDDSVNVQELALCTLIKYTEAEGKTQVAKTRGHHTSFASLLFKPVIGILLSNDRNLSALIKRFQEYLEFDDIRYHTMKCMLTNIRGLADHDISDCFLNNALTMLENISMPASATDQNKKLNNFISKYPENDENIKMTNLKDHRKLFTTLWLEYLKLKLSPGFYKRVLLLLHDKVMPHMTSPLLLSDFLTASYSIGGAISLLALNGIFVLVHQYNLEYPEFYKKLYALFEPTIFNMKYRARFFFLSDLFLTSTHIPAYLVAAFCKRLARLALVAPPNCLTMIIPFICNLLMRHSSCQVIIHRPECASIETDPYKMEEEDPALCAALQSSLWEIKSLQNHYHHSVATAAKMIDVPFPNQEIEMSGLLETTADELIDREVKKKIKVAPTNFDPPHGLFSKKQDPMKTLWTLL